ncbi:MAG: hypothetical protein KGL10_01105 [Alphaproteobacteria bacterium]|nr:hypothetical protein [Alphaproteobacteria bacterium]MDE2335887.1 hypothetical protein [Alphaproteobacteria bacterium]
MKKATSRIVTLVFCAAALPALSACDLRGYIPKPYDQLPAPVAPAPAPQPAPAVAPLPVAPNDGMVIPDIRPLPPAKQLPDTPDENPLDGS